MRAKRTLSTCSTSIVLDGVDYEVEADYRAYPGSPATRTDPKDDGEIEIHAVRLDGQKLDNWSDLPQPQIDRINEAIASQVDGWEDDFEDYEREPVGVQS